MKSKSIYKGRYTAITEQGMVVFLVGMRANQWWAIHKWWPVMRAMRNMLIDLHKHPAKGMLTGHTRVAWPEIMVTTYWENYEKLEDYGRTAEPHLSPWAIYNKKIGSSGSVGIWHETFIIEPKQYECVYVNMPKTGLGRAETVDFVEATGARETSRLRLGGKNRPAVPSPK